MPGAPWPRGMQQHPSGRALHGGFSTAGAPLAGNGALSHRLSATQLEHFPSETAAQPLLMAVQFKHCPVCLCLGGIKYWSERLPSRHVCSSPTPAFPRSLLLLRSLVETFIRREEASASRGQLSISDRSGHPKRPSTTRSQLWPQEKEGRFQGTSS